MRNYLNNYYNYLPNSIPNYYRNNQIDLGPTPSIINIEKRTEENNNYKKALWTGNNIQLILMCIPVGENTGIKTNPNTEQFIKIEEGKALVELGPDINNLSVRKEINSNYALIIPVGTYYNITNISNEPVKLYYIDSPPNHKKGTINITKQ